MGIISPKHQVPPSVCIKYIPKFMSKVLVNSINYILILLMTILMHIKTENIPMLPLQNKNRIGTVYLPTRGLDWFHFATKKRAKKSRNSGFKTSAGLSGTFITLSLF